MVIKKKEKVTVKLWFRNLYHKTREFFGKYGLDAVLALLIFNFPMYAVIWIKGDEFRIFAAWWTALWWGLGPLTPGWLITIVLAIFFRWARMSLWKGILWIKEAMVKLQLQNQLAGYLTSEEITMVLEMAKKVSAESDAKMNIFKAELRRKRLQMIDDQWSKEITVTEAEPTQAILDIENQDD